MIFWRKYTVCLECRVHFEPWPKGAENPTYLCANCRAPIIALEKRIAVVLDWARANWESLEPQAIQFAKERADALQTMNLQRINLGQQAAAGQSALYGSALGNMGIFR